MLFSSRGDSPTPAVRRPRLRAATLTLGVLAGLLTAWPAAGSEAYIVSYGNLVVLDLSSGDTATVGATGLFVLALARSPAGELFAAAKQPGAPENPLQLYTLDPATGTPTLVGTLGDMLLPGDLTFDAEGNLWLVAGGDLYAVDPASGAATAVGAPGGSLDAIAARNGELYGVESAGAGPDRWRLVSVDPTSGATDPIASLPALEIAVYMAMDFDAAGQLWLLVVSVPPITAPPFTTIYRAVDLSSGELESVFGLGEGSHEGLAIAAPRLALEIPVLDRRGLLLLAGLLLAAALLRNPPAGAGPPPDGLTPRESVAGVLLSRRRAVRFGD